MLSAEHNGQTVTYRGAGDAVCTLPVLPRATRMLVANQGGGKVALEPQLPVYPLPGEGYRVVLLPGDQCEVTWCGNCAVRVPR